ncbi:MAG: translation initiation factor IF-2 [Thermoguttaceae bacterium]|nr:translation initiation factor IF-2 [Thermoguttaceae bacterium]
MSKCRVYTLAKELKIEAKDLMELCSKLNIVTKGSSALASISDEDAVRVREHLSSQKSSSVQKEQTPEPVVEPTAPKASMVMGRVPTLSSKRHSEKESAKEVSEKEPAPKKTSNSEKSSETASSQAAEKDASSESPAASKDVSAVKEESAGKASSSSAADASSASVKDGASEKAPAKSSKRAKAETKSEAAASKEKAAETAKTDTKIKAETEASTETEAPKESEPAKPAANARDAGGRTTKDGTPRRRGGNGPLSKKLRRENTEPIVHTPPLSVAEKIAQTVTLDSVNTAIPQQYDNSFPMLQNPRMNRHDENARQGSSANKEKREQRRPGLRLAPLPTAKTPTAKKPPEAQGMRPEMRLTPEEIQAALAGDMSVLRRKEEELEKKAKEAQNKETGGKESRKAGKDRDRKGQGASGANVQGERKERGDRDRKNRRDGQAGSDRSSRQSGLQASGEDSRYGGKKSSGKLRKDSGRRGSGDGESQHSPGRDSRFGGMEKRGKGRRFSLEDDEDENPRFRTKRHKGTSSAVVTAPRKSSYVLQLPLTVRSFAEGVGLSAAKVLGKCMLELGMTLTITSPLDETTALLLAESFGIPVDIRPEVTLEERLIGAVEEEKDAPEDLVFRPPVVTFLGHVDHGKTSLLDKIININVVSGEKGGITQHIRAYNVKYHDKSVTFVDTPGHEAFTEMRARGANATDIAVIVVAADDGVMPQTEEAISHARAAGVPIIVALNKIDLPGVNEMRIFQELSANEITPSEWGGDVEVVRCSALTGQGIDELMDTILMVAELQEYKANPNRAAKGVCIESQIQQGRGVIAKLLVQNGTLHTGDVIVCGSTYGRVKAMNDTLVTHKKYTEAGPAMPVNVLGLDNAPGAGDKFYVLDDIADARRLAEERAEQERLSELAGSAKSHVTLEGLFSTFGSKEVKTLNIILRTDVRGSIEAIKKELGKLEHEEVQIAILQASVGGITEADVHLADASDAIIIGFNVVPDENARVLAEQKGVQIRRYDIIYQLTADVKAALEGMLTPEEREKELGRAIVQQTFQISKVGTVAGCRVTSGTIVRDCKIRIIRNNRVIGTYDLGTLRREKDDVKEVRDGYECGIRLAGFNDVKEGDIFEAFQIESVARTF